MKTLESLTVNQTSATSAQVAKHTPKGKNFMTPYIIGNYFIPHSKHKAEMLVEFSEGTGFDGEPMFGVTCLNNRESYKELSKCFFDKYEAIEYINSLK